MMIFKNEVVTEETQKITISGFDFFYTDFPHSVINNLKGTNCICMASYFNYDIGGRQRVNYTHIGFYDDISKFFNFDSNYWRGITSFYFKNVKNEKEAQVIIEKIKKDHSINLPNQ